MIYTRAKFVFAPGQGLAAGRTDRRVRMQQQQQPLLPHGSQAISNHGAARPHQRTQAATAKKAVGGAQEVDKLLQKRPVKRVSLQTKYARRRRRKKWSVSIVCVTAMNQMKKEH